MSKQIEEIIFIYIHKNYKNGYRMVKIISELYQNYKFVLMSIPDNEAQIRFRKYLIDMNINFDEISYSKSISLRYVIDSNKTKLYKKLKGRSVVCSFNNMLKIYNNKIKMILILKEEKDNFIKGDLFIKAINKTIDNTKILVNVIS